MTDNNKPDKYDNEESEDRALYNDTKNLSAVKVLTMPFRDRTVRIFSICVIVLVFASIWLISSSIEQDQIKRQEDRQFYLNHLPKGNITVIANPQGGVLLSVQNATALLLPNETQVTGKIPSLLGEGPKIVKPN